MSLVWGPRQVFWRGLPFTFSQGQHLVSKIILVIPSSATRSKLLRTARDVSCSFRQEISIRVTDNEAPTPLS